MKYILISLFLLPAVVSSALCSPIEFNEIAAEIKYIREHNQEMRVENETVKVLLNEIDQAVVVHSESGKWAKFKKSFLYGYVNAFDVVMLTPERAPKTYAIIKELADSMQMPVPDIFLMRHEKFFNAAALSFAHSMSAIILGQELANATTLEQFKVILAHELGHIKMNHVRKRMALGITNLIVLRLAWYMYKKDHIGLWAFPTYFLASSLATSYLSRVHEKEADLIAIEVTKNPKDFKTMMEIIENKYDKVLYKDFEYLEKRVAQDSAALPSSFKRKVWMLKQLNNFNAWWSLKSPFASHPAPATRIEYGMQRARELGLSEQA